MLEVDDPQQVFASDASDIFARERLFSLFYDELHRLAERELRQHSAATLSPTTLLHEAFLNIRTRNAVGVEPKQFMSYAARTMRGVAIDYLRSRRAQKRGGDQQIVPLDEDLDLAVEAPIGYERLQDALEELSRMDARLAECIDLKFFCGFSFRDIAKLWDVSERTVLRDWDKARVVLRRLIREASSQA